MQPIDKDDPRKPNIKIAASIRAAILSGELEPGARLPTHQEMARFFGVAQMTVQNAIRKLSDEGFVRGVSGSGVYVRDLANLPIEEGKKHPLAGTAEFLFELGHLKQTPRSGWQLLGVPQPETVAEHSFRVGAIGLVLAALDGADVGQTTALALLHDGHESRIGDVPSVGRAYLSTAAPEAITAHQTAGMPASAAKVVQELTAEYESAATQESRLAHDADKLETLLQAIEYGAQGHDTADWRENSIAALRTDTGRKLAQAIGAADPHDWWKPFNASYAELRASTHARQDSE